MIPNPAQNRETNYFSFLEGGEWIYRILAKIPASDWTGRGRDATKHQMGQSGRARTAYRFQGQGLGVDDGLTATLSTRPWLPLLLFRRRPPARAGAAAERRCLLRGFGTSDRDREVAAESEWIGFRSVQARRMGLGPIGRDNGLRPNAVFTY
jgi:hypothetical protein